MDYFKSIEVGILPLLRPGAQDLIQQELEERSAKREAEKAKNAAHQGQDN